MISNALSRKGRLPAALPQYFWSFFAAALLIIGVALTTGKFRKLDDLLLLLRLASFTGLVAVGQTMVILLGGIDLSVSSAITLGGVVSATIMVGSDERMFLGILIPLLLGAVIGMMNGLGVSLLKIPPLVMTLGMNSLVQGLALIYTNGSPKGNSAPFLSRLTTEAIAGIPYMVILWAFISLFVVFLLHRTSFGRWMYAVGHAPKAAFMSGVNVNLTIILAYTISGLMAALTGVLLTGYTKTSYLNIGDPYQMTSIAAVVIGGTSILGGYGSYLGTIAGTIIIITIQSLLPMLAVPEAGRQIISGSIIIALLLIYGRAKTNSLKN